MKILSATTQPCAVTKGSRCLQGGDMAYEDSSERPQLSDAARDVLAERERQVSAEGWTPEHDDEHNDCEMVLAAIVYAESASGYQVTRSGTWPWHFAWFKPTTPRRDLVKAAALIVAEIERLDRA